MKIGNLEVYGVIYKITNKINNKVYIGQTTQNNGFDDRYKDGGGKGIERVYNHHKSRRDNYTGYYNDYLLKSIEKYGFDSFEVCEIFDVAFSQEELNIKETTYIEIYDSYNNGYNFTAGGENYKRIKTISSGEKVYAYAYFSNEELNEIRSINNIQLEKLLFIYMFFAKINQIEYNIKDLICFKNDGYIFEMANFKYYDKTKNKHYYINKLSDFIQEDSNNKKQYDFIGNRKFKRILINKYNNPDIVIKVKREYEIKNVVYKYLKWRGGNLYRCCKYCGSHFEYDLKKKKIDQEYCSRKCERTVWEWRCKKYKTEL